MLHLSVILFRGGGVSVQGVFPGRWSLSRGGSVQGGLCPGGLFPGGSLSKGVSVQRGVCPGGSLSGRPPYVSCGRYASYWNAFLLNF